MHKRDPVAEIEAYSAPLLSEERQVLAQDGTELTAAALQKKREALASNAFSFFRGTFHLFAADALHARVPNARPRAPVGLIVGDLHLENFGGYRGASGQLCFDVNDFDDVGYGPIDLDLKRLCTSALLVPGVKPDLQKKVARAIAEGWREAVVRLGGRFPVRPLQADKAEEPVRSMLADHGHKKPPALDGPKCAPVSGRWEKSVAAALDGWLENLKSFKVEPPAGKLVQVSYRFRGTGSLGRLSFWALWGHGAERRVFELKEARPSAMDAEPAGPRALMQAAAIRRLQGDPWPLVGASMLEKWPVLVRGIEPDDEKASCETLAAGPPEAFLSYAAQCGEVLARLHVRESAPALLNERWDPKEAVDTALLFAESYAEVVRDDFARFVKSIAS